MQLIVEVLGWFYTTKQYQTVSAVIPKYMTVILNADPIEHDWHRKQLQSNMHTHTTCIYNDCQFDVTVFLVPFTATLLLSHPVHE